ncbi:FAD/NAD(P)-binding protein [Bradyrhizobium sp. U87765 SZCCT0131]|uniref:FAD/NAD(P)-binding protein n=1 Tax=unclassified Bradyrhizobium TaxID=2631580 RepID=UPI001BABFD76|nr:MULTISPECIES: FAD/NAD(P)-binding protein [unclassified Bradyrhizobium]MBR1220880.1 FAD/NAD(P)-binding protein [Bradyrhizobium sp. U87765 SZCCT0131]MBR1260300.1 FAD/NAD(P)-binding protein [Bradyrhizobium sp. U87765 SZCCT0134]MBR1307451.1 FAD/NAD(P)-binding protein [Bradyrhizobium sp. U87765 SZCCT0110]MBR1321405.1 FAD/NAD(P)-binding protein [Bradyrhizobium sp. U87765 SZCCT0109]MBR1349718.1 FAD/NAD(P)-binding protein [Bradyrhizobium sp. U87765 SZCCT0048]
MTQGRQRGEATTTVAIIGGGVSGAATALALRRLRADIDITVIEPRETVGRGLAYSTTDPSHRINVPAPRMEIHPDDPTNFAQWLDRHGVVQADPQALLPDGRLFPSRHAFGGYLSDRFAHAAVAHWRTRASAIDHSGGRCRVVCADGRTLAADVVVLAICHPPPTVPAALAPFAGTSWLVADPWAPQAFDAIANDERLLIVGTGLTMADIVATLDRRGHRGPLVAISRRGQRSQPHTAHPADPFGDFLSPPPTGALALLRRVRATLAQANATGLSWHPVLDQVRLQGQAIWQALSEAERQRLLRHLRPFWDTHRFRVAPQVHAVLERRLDDGTLGIRAATVQRVADRGDRLDVVLRPRRGHAEPLTVDRIVLATGPAHGGLFRDDALLRQMRQQGLARPDVYGLGVAVDGDSRVIDAHGVAQSHLLVAGPLARGTFGELMGVPDVVRHARRVAEMIAHLPALPRHKHERPADTRQANAPAPVARRRASPAGKAGTEHP